MKPLSKSKSESVSSTETQFSRAVYFLGMVKKSKKNTNFPGGNKNQTGKS